MKHALSYEQMILPRLYPIIDFGCFASAPDPVLAVAGFAEELLRGGATLIQYRDKSEDMRRFLSCARELRRVTRDRAMLIVNDRADLCLAAGADGVHLGQDDLSPAAARRIFESAGSRPFAAKQKTLAQPVGERMGHPLLRERMGQPAEARAPQTSPTTAEAPGKLPSESVGFDAVTTSNNLIIGFSTHNLQQVREAAALPVDYIAVGPVFATGSKAKPDPVIGLEGVRQARAATSKPLVAIGGITRKNCRQVVEAGADSVAVIADLLESPVKALEEFHRILG
ncbi:MAG TPA: thiamine phosphate synthase [Candidatus Angelobacter sp.]